ncbi:MAG: DUF1003 domain-containing protein [Saprospiraceae bacterium]|nr:DUF1003 domain-containing protein [Saprospiraceae bacterium]
MAKQTKYIKDLMSAESAHLEKLHQIVRHSLEEEELLTQTLMKADQGSARYGERLADKVAEFGGSWTFIITFAVVLVFWIALNSYFLAQRTFDPYPYILLNLILSCLAAIQAPVIMMSQNRQEAKDRLRSEQDYVTNLKAELEIRSLTLKIDQLLTQQWQHLVEIQQIQTDILREMSARLP